MKYKLIAIIRELGLLKLADSVKFKISSLMLSKRNRDFIAQKPDFPTPPEDLAFDAYNHVDWHEYHDIGLKQARVFAGLIRENIPAGEISILEWGCGPARLIRHLSSLLPGYRVRLHGADYNPRSIAWCRDNFHDIEFVENHLMPPLPYENESFDVSYNFSVLTHLSEKVQRAWLAELWRVLRPGGYLICTTHGDYYRYLLSRQDQLDQYNAGHIVIQGQYTEGKKWFFAIHPPDFVEDDLLEDFEDVRQIKAPEETGLRQDIWLARKPIE